MSKPNDTPQFCVCGRLLNPRTNRSECSGCHEYSGECSCPDLEKMSNDTPDAVREQEPEIRVSIRTLNPISWQLLDKIQQEKPGIIWLGLKGKRQSLCTVAALKDLIDDLKNYGNFAEIAALRAENEALKAALEHYADADNWDAMEDAPQLGKWLYVGQQGNGNNVAREALKRTKENE